MKMDLREGAGVRKTISIWILWADEVPGWVSAAKEERRGQRWKGWDWGHLSTEDALVEGRVLFALLPKQRHHCRQTVSEAVSELVCVGKNELWQACKVSNYYLVFCVFVLPEGYAHGSRLDWRWLGDLEAQEWGSCGVKWKQQTRGTELQPSIWHLWNQIACWLQNCLGEIVVLYIVINSAKFENRFLKRIWFGFCENDSHEIESSS